MNLSNDDKLTVEPAPPVGLAVVSGPVVGFAVDERVAEVSGPVAGLAVDERVGGGSGLGGLGGDVDLVGVCASSLLSDSASPTPFLEIELLGSR